jgi:hypothetical protein
VNDTAALRDHAEGIVCKAWADDGFKARRLAGFAVMATAQVLLILKGLKMVGFATSDSMVGS